MIQVAPVTVVPAKSVCTSATARFATVVSSRARKAAPAATARTFCVVLGTAIAVIAHLLSFEKSTIGRALYHRSNGRASFITDGRGVARIARPGRIRPRRRGRRPPAPRQRDPRVDPPGGRRPRLRRGLGGVDDRPPRD